MTTAKASYAKLGAHRQRYASKYRSGLEGKLEFQLENEGIKANYEEYKIDYIVPASKHKYTPDFVLPNGIIIEAKGIFDAEDRAKHLLIREQYPHLDIRFVFYNSRKTYSNKATVNKLTYADWCEKHGFLYADRWIPEEWFNEEQKSTEGLVAKTTKAKKTDDK